MTAWLRLAGMLLVGTLFMGTACGEPTGVGEHDDLLWEVDGEIFTGPAIADSIVVTGLVDGHLVARHRLTGRLLWDRSFGGPFDVERLIVARDMLIVPHQALYGIDTRTGTTRWRYDEGVQPGGLRVTPGLSGDTVFAVGIGDGSIVSLDARTGTVHWRRFLGNVQSPPAITDDLVIYHVHADIRSSELVALDRRTSEERWRRVIETALAPLPSPNRSAIVGNRLLINLLDRALALRLSDGSTLWSTEARDGLAFSYLGAPFPTEDRVLLTSSRGAIESLSLSTGTPMGSAPINGFPGLLGANSIPCHPYLCISSGRVWIVDPQGSVAWVSDEQGPVFLSSITAADDGILYAGVRHTDGRVRIRAFRPPVQVGATR